jgi:hypothetical protein
MLHVTERHTAGASYSIAKSGVIDGGTVML